MSGYELALIAGVCVSLSGVVLTVRLAYLRWREIGARRLTRRLESLLELAAPALVFGGLALTQLSNLALRVANPTLRFSMVATASSVFVFGVLLGRVFTRWQLHRLNAQIDGATGAIQPHAAAAS